MLPAQNESTPGTTIPEQCTPFGTLCAGPIPIQQQNVTTDPVNATPACQTLPSLCLGPVTVVPGQNESTPFLAPIELVPRSVVSVHVVNTTVDPATVGETQPMGPTNVTVPSTPLTGSFNVTICANPSPVCQQPVAPSFTAHTEVQVVVQVGKETHTVTVPVGLGDD